MDVIAEAGFDLANPQDKQGRFASPPMKDDHLQAAARYVELNPVRVRHTDPPGSPATW